MSQLFEDVRKRLEAATPGPWKSKDFSTGVWMSGNRDSAHFGVERQADAEFIAHSRGDIPKLLEALDVAVGVLEYFAYKDDYNEEALEALAKIKELGK